MPLILLFVCLTRRQHQKKKKVFLAHDEDDARRAGDIVRIEECRPLSKRKHFRIVEVLKHVDAYTDPVTGRTLTKFTPLTPADLKPKPQ